MLTERFGEGLAFAEALHRNQTRKGTRIPYVSHLLAVASIVLEWTSDEDVAIAALLHDAVEDQGGERTAEEIRERFGDYVAELVMACTDSHSGDQTQKAPWLERKRSHLAALANATSDAALITAADKLHNLGSMIRDVRREGLSTLRRFREPESLAWYYAAIAETLAPHAAHAPVAELRQAVSEFVALTGPSRSPP